jgi:hypothetical protein
MIGWKDKKKNCYNCKHIDYSMPDYESNEGEGFYCNGREYSNEREQNNHIEQMNTQKLYMGRPKKCCELVIK